MISRKLALIISFIGIIVFFNSCQEDEGKLPELVFKTGGNYIDTDSEVASAAQIVVGIEAKKAEENDPLISFNISKSVNGGEIATIYNYTLQGNEQETFDYDYTYTVVESAGDEVKLIFTITNRDGLQGQKSLSLSVK